MMMIAWLGAVGCETPIPPGVCEDTLSANAWVDSGPPRFVELWRRGGTNDGEELALPVTIDVSADGRAAVPDFFLGLMGIESDGTWNADLARKGEGPGEISQALGTTWTAEGHLGVFDFERGRAIFVDADRRLVREDDLDKVPISHVLMSGELAGVSFGPDGTGYLQINDALAETGQVRANLLRLPYGGATADTIASIVAPALGGQTAGTTTFAPGFSRLVFDASGDGRLAVAGTTDEYRVTITDSRGATQTICRNVTGFALRADETGEEIGDVDPNHPWVDMIRDSEKPERPAAIGRVFFGRDGRLWVERDRRHAFDGLGTLYGARGSRYDVFERDGSYMGEITAPADTYLMAALDDRVWGFQIGEFDETWVVAYRLER